MDAVDLDAVERIVVGHDGIEQSSAWFLDKVIVYCPCARGMQMLTFDCNRSPFSTQYCNYFSAKNSFRLKFPSDFISSRTKKFESSYCLFEYKL